MWEVPCGGLPKQNTPWFDWPAGYYVNESDIVVSMAKKEETIAEQISLNILQRVLMDVDILKRSDGAHKLPVPVWEV